MTTIQVRRGTAAQWVSAATVLAAGELGLDTTNNILKLGDGSTAWASLNPVLNATYATISSAKETITYNGDGTVATVTETTSGAVTTYTYNGDGTVATEARLLNGVTTTRTFSYSGGNLVGVS